MPVRPALVLSLLVLTPVSAASGASDPSGVWTRGDGNARVRIAPCGGNICATNLWIGDTSGGENVGDRLVLTVSAGGEGTLVGTAYDPQRNLTYSMEMTVKARQLQTRGCVLGGLLCKSVTWSRDE
jgi:uncharacterized protein (DUF2147 family)